MRAGSLDRKIVIQRAVKTKLPSGHEKEDWETLHEVWAQVLPIRGEERHVAMQTTAAAETKFKIRYREGITPLDRLLYEDKQYDITAVIELGRREGLELWGKMRAE